MTLKFPGPMNNHVVTAPERGRVQPQPKVLSQPERTPKVGDDRAQSRFGWAVTDRARQLSGALNPAALTHVTQREVFATRIAELQARQAELEGELKDSDFSLHDDRAQHTALRREHDSNAVAQNAVSAQLEMATLSERARAPSVSSGRLGDLPSRTRLGWAASSRRLATLVKTARKQSPTRGSCRLPTPELMRNSLASTPSSSDSLRSPDEFGDVEP